MVKFYVTDDLDPQWVGVSLETDDWYIEFHLSYFDSDGDWEFYGDEPLYSYIGYSEDIPPIPNFSEKELDAMIRVADWI